MQGLTGRQIEVIRAIVSEYVLTGFPVASKILVDKFGFEFSPATVRKEMSVLEQMGYLKSPHTSAGRIPTDFAFQYYINELIGLYEITYTEKQQLESFYQSAKLRLETLLKGTAHMLAMTSCYLGVVLSPQAQSSIIKRIELVSVIENLVLIVLVTGTGTVYQQRMQLSKSVSQEDLYKVSRFLNQELKGRELLEFQSKGLSEITQGTNALGDLAEIAVQVAQYVVFNPPRQTLYCQGETSLYNEIYAQLPDKDYADSVVQFLSNEDTIIDIFGRLKNMGSVTAKVGIEVDGREIYGISVLGRGYSVGGKKVGALGVIGMTRMPYEKIIPTLEYSAQMLSDVMVEQTLTGSNNTHIDPDNKLINPKAIQSGGDWLLD